MQYKVVVFRASRDNCITLSCRRLFALNNVCVSVVFASMNENVSLPNRFVFYEKMYSFKQK
jgi:hypothetical protein